MIIIRIIITKKENKGCRPGRKAKFLTKNKSPDAWVEYFMRSFAFPCALSLLYMYIYI